MNRRRGLGLLWVLVTLTVTGAVAWFAYQAGLSTAIVSSGHDPAVVQGAYPGYYYGHLGFGFFPFLLFILLLFVIFRGGRRWHRPWWGYGPGSGYGPGWGHGPGQGQPGGPEGPDVPPAIEERLKSWHQKAHQPEAPAGTGEGPGKTD
jgi:hypothetical protein